MVALILLSLALAGCGSVRAGNGSPGGAASAQAPGGSSSVASQSPQGRAKADAAAILAAFVPPPGASRLGSAPTAGGGALSQSAFRESTPDIVDDAGWWRVPGLSPQGVISWEKAHLQRRFAVSGWGGVDPVSQQWWTLPDVAGVLTQRQLTVSAVSDGSGTDLRVDANVVWLPAHPAWAVVPTASTRAVMVTAVPSINDKRKPPTPLTITDPSRVRKLVALVNGLSMSLPGALNCPALEGGAVRLTFLARPGGPVLAVALASDNGCGGVQLTVGSKQVGLGLLGDAAQQALAISGLRWSFYRMPT
ncbi:MAG TPA: hypothetical protein VHZ03_04740 [Trebonia sp.]|nr:hypothetical protein [Trebonia sp.]